MITIPLSSLNNKPNDVHKRLMIALLDLQQVEQRGEIESITVLNKSIIIRVVDKETPKAMWKDYEYVFAMEELVVRKDWWFNPH